MSRIDLVSKNLLANVFRNCHKRNTVIEKKLCQKITYKYQSFHIAKIFFLLLRFLRPLLYFFYTFLIAVLFKSFLLKLRKTFASKFLLTRSILDISVFILSVTNIIIIIIIFNIYIAHFL